MVSKEALGIPIEIVPQTFYSNVAFEVLRRELYYLLANALAPAISFCDLAQGLSSPDRVEYNIEEHIARLRGFAEKALSGVTGIFEFLGMTDNSFLDMVSECKSIQDKIPRQLLSYTIWVVERNDKGEIVFRDGKISLVSKEGVGYWIFKKKAEIDSEVQKVMNCFLSLLQRLKSDVTAILERHRNSLRSILEPDVAEARMALVVREFMDDLLAYTTSGKTSHRFILDLMWRVCMEDLLA